MAALLCVSVVIVTVWLCDVPPQAPDRRNLAQLLNNMY
jgi:hypothetical protein